MRSKLFTTLALPFALVACGGGESSGADDPGMAAFQAFSRGDHAAAVADFDKALAAIEPTAADYKELSVARCEALAHTDADQAVEAMKALKDVTPKEYGRVAHELLKAKNFTQAATVMDLGVQAHAGDPAMGKLKDEITAEINKSGDAAGLEALKGLGYLGGDK